jgi:Tfp pilus assembly protein PilW
MRRRGFALLELLVGTALGFVALAALTATVGIGARLLSTGGLRAEMEDTAQLALEALLFDVRRAGYDPAAIGVEALGQAFTDRLMLTADLDGDRSIDTGSEEQVSYVCNPAAARLSRLVGRQSLPLADGVSVCTFRYFDANGIALPLSAAGLATAERAKVRSITIDLALQPSGLHSPATRRLRVALRTRT